ncbi:hypothetical protein CYG49_03240 [Candidatus Saccharibacteria bacterium]|nr:MAG: hypothetical protein CYG49_03240 [Candidatus Saccharibacteria bacterium]
MKLSIDGEVSPKVRRAVMRFTQEIQGSEISEVTISRIRGGLALTAIRWCQSDPSQDALRKYSEAAQSALEGIADDLAGEEVSDVVVRRAEDGLGFEAVVSCVAIAPELVAESAAEGTDSYGDTLEHELPIGSGFTYGSAIEQYVAAMGLYDSDPPTQEESTPAAPKVNKKAGGNRRTVPKIDKDSLKATPLDERISELQADDLEDISPDVEESIRKLDLKDTEKVLTVCLPFARKVARQINQSLPNDVYEDLVQEGLAAVLDIIPRFDPDRGTKFITFAMHRMRGAMIDWLREQDWVPRSLRAKVKKIEPYITELNSPTTSQLRKRQIYAEIGMNKQQVSDVLLIAASSKVTSLDSQFTASGDKTFADTGLQIPMTEEGFFQVESEMAGARIQMIIDSLPRLLASLRVSDRNASIFINYHTTNASMDDIALENGVSESRISQIVSAIEDKLTAYYARNPELLDELRDLIDA